MLLVFDGNSIMNRAFYALPLNLSSGSVPTNAVLGFMNVFYKAVQTYDPEYVLIAFDKPGKTFRHQDYAEYKAGRKSAPEELKQQFPVIKELLQIAGIPMQETAGFEADDIIGTAVRRAEEKGIDSVILTGDRDALQLISPRTSVLLMKKGISYTDPTDEAALLEQFQVRPDQVIELKALMGDASDHIPGVPGIGEKTAVKLLQEYGDIDSLYARIEEIGGKLKEKLVSGRESAYMSRKLATICTEVPLERAVDDCVYFPPQGREITQFYTRLGLRSLLSKVQPAEEQLSFDLEGLQAEEKSEFDALADVSRLSGAYMAVSVTGDTLSFSCDGCGVYTLKEEGDLPEEVQHLLKEKKLIGHDLKSLMHRFPQGAAFRPCFDTMLAEYLIDANAGRYDLDRLNAKYGLSSELNAGNLYRLYRAQQDELEKLEMTSLMDTLEMPLLTVLYRMEQAGFTVDRVGLETLREEFEQKINDLQGEICRLAGKEFNINSPKQLSEILFTELQLPAAKKTKTGYSTNSQVLEQLADAHPIVPLIIEYRTYAKLLGTYVEVMLEMTRQTPVIRTRLHQAVASTGRISSSEPNLQSIPVRSEPGRRIRSVFVPSDEEHILLDADYSQIELRVLAHMAGDENMIAAFREDRDIHASTAAEVMGIRLEEVTPQQRSYAKAVNFGVVYGISDFGLAKNIGISRSEARDFIDRYFLRYPKIKAYLDSLKAFAYENGYAVTLLGRRRYIPELKASNYNLRQAGERIAMNMPIQGTAADMIKLAMVKIDEALQAEGLQSKMILQVHDELIIDTLSGEEEAVRRILRENMEQILPLSVPLKVDIGAGRSWAESK